MICDICGRKGARIRKVSRTYGKGKDLLVIGDREDSSGKLSSLWRELPDSRDLTRN